MAGGLVALAAALPLDAAASVSARVDPAMSGFFADEELVPPLVERWSIPILVGNVLAADGRVYATDGTSAMAFALADGSRLWTTQLTFPRGTAYDGGLLLVRDSRRLVALDGATGAVRWETELVQEDSFRDGRVAAADGVVYVGDQRGTRALRATDGRELWSAPVPSRGGAAVDDSHVYTMGSCGQVYATKRGTGEPAWHAESDCTGGGLDFPAVHGGRVWASRGRYVEGDGHLDPEVYDAAAGTPRGEFVGELPVFVDGAAVTSVAGSVRALDPATLTERWRSEGSLSAPIAIGHDVYGFRDDRLVALSAEDGRELWARRPPGDGSSNQAETAAAPGTLVIAYDERLTAYESYFKPAPRAVALGASSSDVTAGEEVRLIGVLGRELRGVGVRVRLEGAERRGRFERFRTLRAARDGGFSIAVVVHRNSRFRVQGPGEGSEVVRVYATPRVILGRPRRGVTGVSVRTPRTFLAGRTLVLYRDPGGGRPLARLAAGTLRAEGPGRARTRLALRNRRGDLVFCVRGQLKLGLGRPNALNRRCGARRIAS